jgi:hypothetical protein
MKKLILTLIVVLSASFAFAGPVPSVVLKTGAKTTVTAPAVQGQPSSVKKKKVVKKAKKVKNVTVKTETVTKTEVKVEPAKTK